MNALTNGICASVLSFSLQSAPAADPRYKADIEFFLGAFESKAGHFFEQKGIDWDAVAQWARSEVEMVASDADHLRLCARLVARLKDGHARIEGAEVAWPEAGEGRKWRFPKVGMIWSGGRAIVASVDPDLGIPLGSVVTGIEGKPVEVWLEEKADEWSDRRGYSTRHHVLHEAAVYGLGGWEGTRFAITATRPDGKEVSLEVNRNLGENAPVRLDLGAQLGEIRWLDDRKRTGWATTTSGNGYIRLAHIPSDLPDQLDTIFGLLGDVPGVVLDLRGNRGGGCDHQAVFSRFVDKGEYWGPVEGAGEHPYAGPVVVIVDAGTLSAGETVSGMLAEDQRALMIGTSATAGMSSSKTTMKAPSGMFSVRFSVRSNKQRFNRGRGIEGIGVQPHIVVDQDPQDFARGRDTLIARAEDLLKAGAWPETIDYDGRGK